MMAARKTTRPDTPAARSEMRRPSLDSADVLHEQIDRATAAMLRGDAGRARELLLSALERCPGHPDARRLLAKIPERSSAPPAPRQSESGNGGRRPRSRR